MSRAPEAAELHDDTFTLGGDLSVRRIGFGTMRLTDATGDGTHAGATIWQASPDPSAEIAVLRRAVDLGVQLIDTADAYALGDSENLIARALHPYPDDLVLATKVGNVRPSPSEWVPLGHPAYLKQQVELSLRRLRVERVHLLQLHRLDPDFPIADQIGALAELQAEGKIAHIGLSEVSVDELEEARLTAPIAAVQNLYNLVTRHHEAVLRRTTETAIAFLPFFPLAVGGLARRGSVLDSVAKELDATASQVAIAWLLRRAKNVLPVPGTASASHLEQNVQASRLILSDEHLRQLDALHQSAAEAESS